MLAFVLSGALLSGQTQPPANGTIGGTVINTATAKPVAGARIKLGGPSNEAPQARYTKSDGDGRFEFVNLRPGGYGLWAQSPGLSQGEPNNWDRVELSAGHRHAVVTIPLSPISLIFGKLTDTGGFPVAGAAIEVILKVPAGSKKPDFWHLRTDDQGEFRTEQLGPGTYYLKAKKEGLGRQWDPATRDTYYPQSRDLGAATPIEVAVGQQVRADIRLVRQAAFRVTGRLVGSHTARGAFDYTIVSLDPHENKGNPNVPFINTKSHVFELTDILPGKYRLSAATIQQLDPSGKDRKIILAGAQDIELTDGDVRDVEVKLQPLRDLPGTVTFPKGCKPVPFTVIASTSNRLGYWVSEAIVAADGKFVLTGFTPSHYSLSVLLVDFKQPPPKVISAALGARDAMSGFEYPFPEGSDLQIAIDCPTGGPRNPMMMGSCIPPGFQPSPDQFINGDIFDSVTGAPIAGAYLMSDYLAWTPATVSNSKGRFRLPETGRYRVERAGYLPELWYDAERSPMHVALTPQAVIFGKVTDEDGFPVGGALVRSFTFRSIDGRRELQYPVLGVRTNDLGEYRYAALPAGRYYLRVDESDLHYWDRRYGAQYYPGTVVLEDAAAIEIKAGEKRQVDIKVNRHEGVTVTGSVEGLEGVPAIGGPRFVRVCLIPEDESSSVFQRSCEAEGESFSFVGVTPGNYTVRVATGGEPVRFGEFVARQRVEVGKSNVSGIVLRIRPVEASDLPNQKTRGR